MKKKNNIFINLLFIKNKIINYYLFNNHIN